MTLPRRPRENWTLTGPESQMSTIIYYAIPIFIVSMLVELGYSRLVQKPIYEWRDSLACLGMGLGNVAIAALAKTVTFIPFFWIWENHRLFDIPMTAWWAWALILVAEDFCYYWFHRLHHEVRCLWAAHVNHHSSEHFNLAVALRQSWTTPLTGFIFWMPLAFIGFHPLMILTQQAVSLIYQFFIHAQQVPKLGPLEWAMNTPSHHRVHHGANARYLDKNYAGIFIVWDRLFGTFEPEVEPVRYGLTRNIGSFNLLHIAFHEWAAIGRDLRAATNWRARLRYVFGRPGDLGTAR